MAIRHLFWKCPTCGAIGGVRVGDRGDRCTRCGTTYERGRGSLIRATRNGQPDVLLEAAEWVDKLGDIDQLRLSPTDLPPEPVEVREARPRRPVRGNDGTLIGWVEEFGPPDRRILLLADAIHLRAADGDTLDIAILEITAIHASSSALLLKTRERPVLSIRFLEGSLRLWEHAIRQRIRDVYMDAGLGVIREFHPHIVPNR